MQTTTFKLPNQTRSIAVASMLSLTACAWGITGACKTQQAASHDTTQNPTTSTAANTTPR